MCHAFHLINLYRLSFHQEELAGGRNWNVHWEGFWGPSAPVKPSRHLRLMCHALDWFNLNLYCFHQEEFEGGRFLCLHTYSDKLRQCPFGFLLVLLAQLQNFLGFIRLHEVLRLPMLFVCLQNQQLRGNEISFWFFGSTALKILALIYIAWGCSCYLSVYKQISLGAHCPISFWFSCSTTLKILPLLHIAWGCLCYLFVYNLGSTKFPFGSLVGQLHPFGPNKLQFSLRTQWRRFSSFFLQSF